MTEEKMVVHEKIIPAVIEFIKKEELLYAGCYDEVSYVPKTSSLYMVQTAP